MFDLKSTAILLCYTVFVGSLWYMIGYSNSKKETRKSDEAACLKIINLVQESDAKECADWCDKRAVYAPDSNRTVMR